MGADPEAVATPPLLMAVDMLYRDGRDLTTRPLRNRRARAWKTSWPTASWRLPSAEDHAQSAAGRVLRCGVAVRMVE